MNGLTQEDLRHLGRLAQLELSDDDLEHLEGELSRIVGYVEQLAAVDVEGVDPLIQPVELPTVTRPDEPAPGDAAAAVVSAAPRLKDGMYVVPPVIENP
jgi:aspartyl-tRNA(Asn)/glutamyl-tRNA(Gln) amidotransferase subunit C